MMKPNCFWELTALVGRTGSVPNGDMFNKNVASKVRRYARRLEKSERREVHCHKAVAMGILPLPRMELGSPRSRRAARARGQPYPKSLIFVNPFWHDLVSAGRPGTTGYTTG